MVTIKVGPEETPFRIHKAIVCSQSTYFDKAFSGGFEEATTGVVTLTDVDADLFSIVSAWLYTGMLRQHGTGIHIQDQAHSEAEKQDIHKFEHDRPETWAWQMLMDLYFLADRLTLHKLRNALIDAMIRRSQDDPPDSPQLVQQIYEQTTSLSPLRALVLDAWAYDTLIAIEPYELRVLPKEFLGSLLEKVAARIPAEVCASCHKAARLGLSSCPSLYAHISHSKKDEAPYMVDNCLYHSHESPEDRMACQMERRRREDQA